MGKNASKGQFADLPGILDAHYEDLMGTEGNINQGQQPNLMDRTMVSNQAKNRNVLEFSNTGINVNSSKNLNSNISRGQVDQNSNFSCEVGASGFQNETGGGGVDEDTYHLNRTMVDPRGKVRELQAMNIDNQFTSSFGGTDTQ